MTLDDCFSTLQIEAAKAAIGVEWERSQKSFSQSLPFLDADFLRTTTEKYFDDPQVFATLMLAVKRLKNNAAALRLLWHQHYLVVQNYERFWWKCYEFPELPVLQDDARAFYLLLALSGPWHFGDLHAKYGISREELTASIEELRNSVRSSLNKKKLLGLAPHFSGWWQGFFSGRLYRLGRLTFLQEKYNWPFHLLENRNTHEILVLAGNQMQFNSRGLCALKNEPVAWTSTFNTSNINIEGQRIDPSGYAQKELQTISSDEWREMVLKGEEVISVHISAGEPLNMDACVASFQQAKKFFQVYFPSKKFKLFTCDTWLLDPQLKEFLDEKSNIVQFQKQFFLLPHALDAEFVPIRSIFGAQALLDWKSVRPETSLQKGAAEFKRTGGVLRHGYGFIPWTSSFERELA